MTSKVTFLILIGYEALFAMVVVSEWQVVIDDKFYEMGPWSHTPMLTLLFYIYQTVNKTSFGFLKCTSYNRG